MEVVILGCGTSTGVPIVGCNCKVCSSPHQRNKRLRSSIVVTLDSGENILIDTSPDLRQQALQNNLVRVNAVFYTHCHADHTHGIDEIRTYNYLQKQALDIYGAQEHIDHIRDQFRYIFEDSVQRGGGKPNVITHPVTMNQPFTLFGTTITPIQLWHGKLLVVGWRIGDFAYLTDVNRIPPESWSLLKGVQVVIMDALRYHYHDTHFTVEQAVEALQQLGAPINYLTHMGHELEYEDLLAYLPDGVEPAYDGLHFRV